MRDKIVSSLRRQPHMNKKSRLESVYFLAMIMVITACGVTSNGLWVDQPENWRRAFNEEKPVDVHLVHSMYWQSPHWTNEFEYYFEVTANDQLLKSIITKYSLVKRSSNNIEIARANCFSRCPEWFVPHIDGQYEVWIGLESNSSNFQVVVDMNSGNIFISNYQV